MSERLLAIGLDGFELSVAEPLLRQGRMPWLQTLLRKGARVDLDHGSAKRTGLAWEHFATGLGPERARRFSAVTFDPMRYRAIQEPTRLAPFAALNEFPTVVFDPPYFDLARAPAVRGLVSWGAHDPGTREASRPDSLSAEIQERFGDYPAQPWIYGFTWTSAERTREMGQALAEAAARRAAIGKWLLRERLPDWSLGIVVVSEPHSAIEALWHGVDPTHRLHRLDTAEPARTALEAVYVAIDDLLGTLAQAFPDAALAVFSMHGMGANTADVPAMALLPEYLYRRTFGKPHLRAAADDPVAVLQSMEAASWSTHVRERWLDEAAARQPVRRSALTRLGRRFRRFRRHRPPGDDTLSWMPAAWYASYWPAMPAFALPAFYDGQIRLNVQGREARGLVAPENYDALCDALTAELEAFVDPASGEAVVAEVVRTHPGDPLAVHDTSADLIVVWRGSPLALQTERCGLIGPVATRRPGGHTGGHGLSLWVGDRFVAGEHGARPAFDVVPTLIDYFTGESDSRVDGTSFLDVITKCTQTTRAL